MLPSYYEEAGRWRAMMKQAIAQLGAYFNSHRMLRRYATQAYLR